MNRENKRKKYDKNYFKTHPCTDPFTCRVCGGIMEPVAVWVRKTGEWALIHRCRRCRQLSSNRIAADDNPIKLMSIAMKPLSLPPFPLERMEELARLMDGSL